jgi:hypothetical protein
MIEWGVYREMLESDGVRFHEAEYEALTDAGERITAFFATREVQGRFLHAVIQPFESDNSHVPVYVQKQIMNQLALNPERYNFGRL